MAGVAELLNSESGLSRPNRIEWSANSKSFSYYKLFSIHYKFLFRTKNYINSSVCSHFYYIRSYYKKKNRKGVPLTRQVFIYRPAKQVSKKKNKKNKCFLFHFFQCLNKHKLVNAYLLASTFNPGSLASKSVLPPATHTFGRLRSPSEVAFIKLWILFNLSA